ncbi:YcnI family protein [Paenibacillus alginolyticus]|uniref:YcnI family protein n=1 Tax=Paenibacillus alginolyticus TaxID=59839 RepID=A0ABT4GLG0_9BACL|nr:YcnI family protein [Paenibacillus alginolyticus]MCY9668839.1 YcnI family protein [Paenibacillus alginolyticus]MCY9697036.1 YcnI family protein [Paenibacillus alginolyticus]MEC0142174.1 YcnI family protein [Paenibacillus alginolyticus]
MFKKLMLNAGIMLIGSMLLAGIASAHVVVYPKETTQGSYEKFTVRVPSEKDIPTVKVEVKFPMDAVAVSRFEPKAGWTYELAKDSAGKITGVTWKATGDGLASTEFGEFNMQGKVADAATEIVWKAYQTYKDGSVVEWVGANGSDKPASVTTVKAKAAGGATTDSHGQVTAGSAAAGGTSSNTSLYLSIAAVVLGALSLIVSLTKKRK